MKRKYIVFYAVDGGYGNTEIKVSRKERPCSVKNIRAIESEISKGLNKNVALINYKFAGLSWK